MTGVVIMGLALATVGCGIGWLFEWFRRLDAEEKLSDYECRDRLNNATIAKAEADLQSAEMSVLCHCGHRRGQHSRFGSDGDGGALWPCCNVVCSCYTFRQPEEA